VREVSQKHEKVVGHDWRWAESIELLKLGG
jgi:hypothetical protein